MTKRSAKKIDQATKFFYMYENGEAWSGESADKTLAKFQRMARRQAEKWMRLAKAAQNPLDRKNRAALGRARVADEISLADEGILCATGIIADAIRAVGIVK